MSLSTTAEREAARRDWSAFICSRFGADEPSGRSSHLRDSQLELDLLQEFSAVAKRKINARTIAARMPPELLGIIFAFLREAMPGSMRWMVVAAVCSSWREVTFAQPSLWRDISSDINLEARSDILARSKSLPLHLTLDFYDGHEDLRERALWFHKWLSCDIYSRIQTLSLHNIDPDLFDEIIEAIPTLSAMPLLAELSITVSDYWVLESPPHIVPSTVFEERLSAGNKLSRITLKGCLPDNISVLQSPTLTHISLATGSLFVPGEEPDTEDILNLLSALPNLCEFELSGLPRPRYRNSVPASEDVVCLPASFRALKYTADPYNGGTETMPDLLSHLKLPMGASITVDVHQDFDPDHQTTEFAEIVSAALGTFDHDGALWTLDVDLSSARIDIVDVAHPGLNTSSISVTRQSGTLGLGVAGSLHQLPLQTLSSLKLSPSSAEYRFCDIDRQYWLSRLLQHAHLLHTIVITAPYSVEVIEALGIFYEDEDGHTEVLFPQLQSITLETHPLTPAEDLIDFLTTFDYVCAWRSEQGCAVRTMLIGKRFKDYIPSSLCTRLDVQLMA